jgi:hypothetical protein
MKASRHIAWVPAMLVLGVMGCSGSKVLPSSGPRAAGSPDAVKLYQTPPHRYERLGQVSVPVGGDVHWDASANADAGFDRLKEGAAQLGANGLLLQMDGPDYGRVLAGYHNTYYQVPFKNSTPRTAVAEAIYVVEK